MEKTFIVDVKQAGETGVFQGALSTYGGRPDLAGDVVMPGAFATTLAESGGILPLLLNHDASKQIGVLKLRDTPNALVADGKFNLDSAVAREAYQALKFNLSQGLKSGLSIGYKTVKSYVKNGVNYLTEISLFEGSLTPIPCNPSAVVSSVKRAGNSDLQSMVQRFDAKLKAIIGPELKAGRVISAANMQKLRAAHEHLQNASASHAAANSLLAELMADAASGGPDPTPASSDDLGKMVASFGRRLNAAIRS